MNGAPPRAWWPARRADAHKNDFGHVGIIGGARGLSGAPRLAAAGALRGGAGLVTLAVPRSVEPIAAAGGPWEALTLGLPETGGALAARAVAPALAYLARRRVTAVALGPGLSVTRGTAAFVAGFLRRVSVPVVLDADGLNALSRWPVPRPPLVLTPHAGEAARLLGTSAAAVQRDRPAAARRLALASGGICVLKGHRTLITDGRRRVVNRTGNPGLATAGTGDVLAGLIAALVPQVAAPDDRERLWRAAVLGAHLHGLSGDLAAGRRGWTSVIAGDVVDNLAGAFRWFLGSRAFGPRAVGRGVGPFR